MDPLRPSQLLTVQHHQIDRGIEDTANGSGQLPALAASLHRLRVHLYVEEVLLFPALAKAGLTMPVFVMQREHGQMWPLLETLAAACASGADPALLHEPARQLYQLLQMHNPKEEQIVYSGADRLADAVPLATSMAAVDAAPAGWVCKLAPR